MHAPDVFVSYSRVHDGLVDNLTKILGVGGRLVFRDVESVKPGEEWERRIFDSLKDAKIVVVVWCSHANESPWVLREAELAAQLNKEIIPVLIDSTPLLPCLAKFQWIDLQREVIHGLRLPENLPAHQNPPFWPVIAFGVSTVLFFLLSVVLLFAFLPLYFAAPAVLIPIAAFAFVIWIVFISPESLGKSKPEPAKLPDFGTVPFNPSPYLGGILDPVSARVLARIAEIDRRQH